MRKAIFSAVLALALAGVASALPTMSGGGGTIYVDMMATGVSGQTIFYIDVNSDWTLNAQGTYATVADTAMPGKGAEDQSRGYGVASALKTDMGGVYHNGGLVLSANGGLITLDGQTPTPVVVNSGDPGFSFTKAVAVPAGMTPDGTRGVGTVSEAGRNLVWTDGYTTRNPATNTYIYGQADDPARENSKLAAGDCDTTITLNSVAYHVTGVMAWAANNPGTWPDPWSPGTINMVYRVDDGTYVFASEGLARGVQVGRRTDSLASWALPIAVADTNDDGIPDFYFHTAGGAIEHVTDLNGNGSLADDGEYGDSGVVLANWWLNKDITLFKGLNGQWAMLGWDNGIVTIYPLDGDGQFLAGTQLQIATGILAGAQNDTYGGGISFLPLGEAGGPIVPEPATMLLVGTGVLGLAGVIRRRLIG